MTTAVGWVFGANAQDACAMCFLVDLCIDSDGPTLARPGIHSLPSYGMAESRTFNVYFILFFSLGVYVFVVFIIHHWPMPSIAIYVDG